MSGKTTVVGEFYRQRGLTKSSALSSKAVSSLLPASRFSPPLLGKTPVIDQVDAAPQRRALSTPITCQTARFRPA